MILDKLELKRELWGEKKGMLTGRVRFTDHTENAIELNLTPELNEKFMAVIGEALIGQARLVQERLIANMVDCSPIIKQIEAPNAE